MTVSVVNSSITNGSVASIVNWSLQPTQVAGTSQVVTVSFRDATNALVDTQASLTFTGTSSGTILLARQSLGVSTATLRFTQAGSYTLSIANFIATTSVSVIPSLAQQLVLTMPNVLRTDQTTTLTITLRDSFGNLADGIATMSVQPSTTRATISPLTRQSLGVSTGSFQITTVGTFTVQATIGSAITQATVVVQAGSVAQSVVSVDQSSVMQGSTVVFTARYADSFGYLSDPTTTPSMRWVGQGVTTGTITMTRLEQGVYSASYTAMVPVAHTLSESIFNHSTVVSVGANLPAITSVQPAVVGQTGQITITGVGLANATITIDGRTATILSQSNTTLLVQIPPGSSVNSSVVVTTPFGSTQTTIMVLPATTLSSVQPQRVNVGTEVIITGTHLQWVNELRIGDVAVQPRQRSTTSIVVVIPVGTRNATVEASTSIGTVRLENAFSLMQARLTVTPQTILSLPIRLGQSTSAQYTITGQDIAGTVQISAPSGVNISTGVGVNVSNTLILQPSTSNTINQTITLQTQRTTIGTEQIAILHAALGTQATLTWTVQTLPINTLPSITTATEMLGTRASMGNPVVVRIRVSDRETPPEQLTLSVQSQSLALIPASGIQFLGSTILSGGNTPIREWVYRITPERRANGLATLLISASDGEATQALPLGIMVESVPDTNRTPRFTVPSSITMNQNASAQTVVLTDVSAGSGDADAGQILSWSVRSSDVSLIARASVVYQQGSSTAQLIVTPEPNVSGEGVLSIMLRDNGGTAFNAQDSIVQNITFTIIPNKPVTPGGIVVLQPFAESLGSTFAVTQLPPQSVILRFTTSPLNTSIVGLPFDAVEQARSEEVSYHAYPTQIASEPFLQGVYAPRYGFASATKKSPTEAIVERPIGIATTKGSELLQRADTLRAGDTFTREEMEAGRIGFIDRSNTLGTQQITFAPINSAGQRGAPIRVAIDVVATNETPTLSGVRDVMVNERTRVRTSTSTLSIIVNDKESTPQSLIVRVLSSDTRLIPTNNIVIRQAGGGNRVIEITPAERVFGTATLILTVSDGQTQRSEQCIVTVREQNTAPTIASDQILVRLRPQQESTATFTLDDIDGDDVSFRIFSSDERVLPMAGISIVGANNQRVVSYRANNPGTVQLTATAGDGRLTSTTTLTIVVTPPTSIAVLPISSMVQSIAPNPASEEVQIRFAIKRSEDTKVSMMNMLGQTVMIQTAPRGSEAIMLNIRTLPSGTYRVVMQDSRGMATQQIVVVR